MFERENKKRQLNIFFRWFNERHGHTKNTYSICDYH